MVRLKYPKRSLVESVLLTLVFIVLLIFMVNSYTMEQRTMKEKNLVYELTILRQGIATFYLVDKRLPKNLVELATSVFKLPGDEANRRFVERVTVNDQGMIIDPFNNPYNFHREKGWVASTTKKYSNW